MRLSSFRNNEEINRILSVDGLGNKFEKQIKIMTNIMSQYDEKKAEMIEKIKELEKHALQLEPNNEDRLHWQRKVEQYAFKFIDDLPHTKTYIPTEDGGKDLLNI